MFWWQIIIGLGTVMNIWMLTPGKWWGPWWCLCNEIHWTVYVVITGQWGFFFGMQIPLLISWIRMITKWWNKNETK